MRAVKNAAVILAVCLIVVCGAFMPSIISDMQNHWLRSQTDTRDMELLSELDLSDPTVMDAFWLYSNHVSSVLMSQGDNLTEQEAVAAVQEAVNLLKQNKLIPDIVEEPNQFVAIHPNLIIVDAGEIKSSVIWYCSWENAGASNCTMVLDDATGKMLSFQLYKIYSDETVPEDFGVFQETAERWLDFCRSYYGNSDISMTKDMYSPNIWTMKFPISNGDVQRNENVQLVIADNVIYFH